MEGAKPSESGAKAVQEAFSAVFESGAKPTSEAEEEKPGGKTEGEEML